MARSKAASGHHQYSGSGQICCCTCWAGWNITGGKVYYEDADLYQYNDNQLSLLRRRRWIVFQAYNLVQELTAYENILLPVMLDKKQPDKAYIDNLSGDAEHWRPPSTWALSAGSSSTAIHCARIASNKVDILFAGNQTGNLNGMTGREVLSLLRLVGRTGRFTGAGDTLTGHRRAGRAHYPSGGWARGFGQRGKLT